MDDIKTPGAARLSARRSERGSALREAIEAVLLAAVLVLAIREYILQAFKIPSGSMAPALLGEHRDLACPNCGRRFAVGVGRTPGGYVDAGRETLPVVCPNCGFSLDPAVVNNKVCSHFPAWPRALCWKGYYRILANRLVYNFRQPQRWEVIVFKSPPKASAVPADFIKRIIGLPGEKVLIQRGNIYVQGEIARKPLEVQNSMWQLVYTSNRPEKQHAPLYPHWISEVGSLAELADGIELRRTARGESRVRFANPVAAYLAYNRYEQMLEPYPAVGEMKFECRLAQAGKGKATIVIEQDDHKHECELSLDGSRLESITLKLDGKELASQSTPHDLTPESRLAFCHADAAMWVELDGKPLLRKEFEPYPATPIWSFSSGLTVAAQDSDLSLHDIRIYRDVLYFSSGIFDSGQGVTYGVKEPADIPTDSYYVLGDNSLHSSDGRYWGFVPRSNIIGKAVIVWWPPAELHPL